MNKMELAKAVAKKTGVIETYCNDVITAAIEIIRDTLVSGEPVYLKGFATFTPYLRPQRSFRSAALDKVIDIPSRVYIKTEIHRSLKHRLYTEAVDNF